MTMRQPKIAIIGTVGLPARYGGFETLVENLVGHATRGGLCCEIDVYCSAEAYPDRASHYQGARLRYLPLKANGAQSIIYDALSMVLARLRGADILLVLGVSGAFMFPLLRLTGGPTLVINVDGLEWRRAKWGRLAARFLKWSERIASRYAHRVIADNQAIVDHLKSAYGSQAVLIPYGGDHAGEPRSAFDKKSPITIGTDHLSNYAIMLCRIEPENNVSAILEAFQTATSMNLVAVGNWDASNFGREMRSAYADCRHIFMLDPVYEPVRLHALRVNASLYLHGHSAGGTNPALVEMMWLGCPVLAFDCAYNRYTTENRAAYFEDADDLRDKLKVMEINQLPNIGERMREIAQRRYRWNEIARKYFDILMS